MTRAGKDVTSRGQLSALAEVHAFLEAGALDYWLFGGWAVDFHVGRITRPHSDLDLAVWLQQLPRIRRLLEGAGWRHAPQPDEDGGTGFERRGIRLELTFLVREPDGGICTPLRDARPRWAEDAFGDDFVELDGVTCRVVSRASLVRSKSRFRDEHDERAKDELDHSVLVAGADR